MKEKVKEPKPVKAGKAPGRAKSMKMSLHTKDKLKGLFFVSPFIIGVLLFFVYPISLSLRLSFGEIVSIVGMRVKLTGIQNYTRAFLVDTKFIPTFLEMIRQTLVKYPLTIVLSLIIAMLINRDIACRGLFRIIFFIPFLLGVGKVMQQLLNQGVDRSVLNIMDGRLIPYNVLSYFGSTIIEAVQTIIGLLVTVLWGSGVQILLFLSGLQSISPALYEAARIDGATEWEIFWKVTVPMISPMLLLNLVYTLVDSFTNITNPMLEYIQANGAANGQFEYGAALGWIYFAFVGVTVAIVFGVMKGYMHTNEVEEVKKRERKHRIFTIEKKPRRTFE